jgi:hypothetical protein
MTNKKVLTYQKGMVREARTASWKAPHNCTKYLSRTNYGASMLLSLGIYQ